MQLKNKKRTMLALMSLMLATTGCASKTDYKDAPFSRINEIISEDPDIQNEYYYNSVSNIYQTYLSNFIDYMSEEQYNKFLVFAEKMDYDELNEFSKTFTYLNDIFNVTDTSYGRGFYKTFNSLILSECVNYHGENGASLNNHVNTLCALAEVKPFLYEAIFSNDINKVIDVIIEWTHYDNRDNLEELFLKMDLYYDLINSKSYSAQTLMASYDERITEIIGEIIQAKRENNEFFSESLYARLLEKSPYNGGETYTIIRSLTKRTNTIKVSDGVITYTIENVPYEYLKDNYTLEEIKRYNVEQIINNNFNGENTYDSKDTLYLIMCLMNSNPDFTRCKTSSDIRSIMYKDLSSCFASEDEFNTFFLRLYSKSPNIYQEYLELFAKRVQEDGISYKDFMRYNCLRNYINSRLLMSVEFPYGTNRLTKEELASLKPEELDEDTYVSKELVLIDKEVYAPYFNYIDGLFVDSNYAYDCMYNPDVMLNWSFGHLEYVNEENNKVISSRIVPKTMSYNGTNIVYYEYPKYYEDGMAIEVFENVFEARTTREIDGFRATITDPETGEEKVIFVVDMTSSLKTYPIIHFIEDYETLVSKQEEYELSPYLYLGGSYE